MFRCVAVIGLDGVAVIKGNSGVMSINLVQFWEHLSFLCANVFTPPSLSVINIHIGYTL